MNKFFFKLVGLILLGFLFGGCGIGDLVGEDNGDSNSVVWLDGAEVSGESLKFKKAKGDIIFDIEIADTMNERATGLMYRKEMPENRGMLFIFNDLDERNFWMKDTFIPLDMIFFDSNYKVVRIVKNARPCESEPCEVFSSVRPARYVLEINGGLSSKYGIVEGDIAEVKL